MNEVFRVYTSPDMLGIELGASLKNVIALAAGMADGLGYGDNTKAALITRGIKEISRLGVAMGANTETLNGLSGIGDLLFHNLRLNHQGTFFNTLGHDNNQLPLCDKFGQIMCCTSGKG